MVSILSKGARRNQWRKSDCKHSLFMMNFIEIRILEKLVNIFTFQPNIWIMEHSLVFLWPFLKPFLALFLSNWHLIVITKLYSRSTFRLQNISLWNVIFEFSPKFYLYSLLETLDEKTFVVITNGNLKQWKIFRISKNLCMLCNKNFLIETSNFTLIILIVAPVACPYSYINKKRGHRGPTKQNFPVSIRMTLKLLETSVWKDVLFRVTRYFKANLHSGLLVFRRFFFRKPLIDFAVGLQEMEQEYK